MHEQLFIDIDQAIREKKEINLVDAAPRGYAKSTIVSLATPLWAAINGYCKYIVLVSDTASQANDFLSAIKEEFENNELLIADYGDLVGLIWTNSDLVTLTGIRIQALGVGKKIRGRRYKQYRPDLIIGDDLENDEQVRSAEQRQKAKIWFNKALSKAGTKDTVKIIIGTVLHNDSLLSSILKNPTYKSRLYKAIMSWSESPLWLDWEKIVVNLDNPNRMEEARTFYETNKDEMLAGTQVLWEANESYYDLMLERIAQGPNAFLSEKQNEPVNEDERRFEVEWIQYYEEDDIKDRDLYDIGYIDPSLGKAGGDDSAIVIIGYESKTGYIFVREADIQKRHPDNITLDALAWHKVYHLQQLGIEDVAFQELLKDDFSKAVEVATANNEMLPLSVRGIHNHTDKILRIQSLQPDIKSGRIKFKKNQQKLIQQLLDFPSADHDDGPDALQGAVKMLGKRTALEQFFRSQTNDNNTTTTKSTIQNAGFSGYSIHQS